MMLSVFMSKRFKLSSKSELLRVCRLLDSRIIEVGLTDEYSNILDKVGYIEGKELKDFILNLNKKYIEFKPDIDKFSNKMIKELKKTLGRKFNVIKSIKSLDATKIELELMELLHFKNIKELNSFIYDNTNIPMYKVLGVTSISSIKRIVLNFLLIS